MEIGERFLAGPLSRTVRSVEVLDVLRFEKNSISVVCRAQFRNPWSSENALFDDRIAKVQELARDRNGARTYFVRRRLPEAPGGVNTSLVYLTTPWRVENGVGRGTLLGSAREIRSFLRSLENAGFTFRIISLTDARFFPGSLLNLLTDRQRQVLAKAFEQGYYDIPRKMGSDDLARELGMRNATFVAHRRKAERRLLGEILGGF
jgi:HTH DNA binding domain